MSKELKESKKKKKVWPNIFNKKTQIIFLKNYLKNKSSGVGSYNGNGKLTGGAQL